MLRPYEKRAFDLRPHNGQDTMDVIGHDNERLEFDLRKVKGDFQPDLMNDAPEGGQTHSAVCDLAEKTALPEGANRHEVESTLGVIESLEADGAAVKIIRIGL